MITKNYATPQDAEQAFYRAFELADLSDLGGIHFVVLEMLAEQIHTAREAGFSKADIHMALSDDVVLHRQHRAHQVRGARPDLALRGGRPAARGDLVDLAAPSGTTPALGDLARNPLERPHGHQG